MVSRVRCTSLRRGHEGVRLVWRFAGACFLCVALCGVVFGLPRTNLCISSLMRYCRLACAWKCVQSIPDLVPPPYKPRWAYNEVADSLPQSFMAAREARAAFLERLIGEHAPGVAVPAAVMLAIGVGHHRGMTVHPYVRLLPTARHLKNRRGNPFSSCKGGT